MKKEDVFGRRSEAEITKRSIGVFDNDPDLVHRIRELEDDEAIEISEPVLRGGSNWNYRMLDYEPITQPNTLCAARCSRATMQDLVNESMARISSSDEPGLCVGYSFMPALKTGGIVRRVPFFDVVNAIKKWTYSRSIATYDNRSRGLLVLDYANADRAQFEGGMFSCLVPREESGRVRRPLELVNVPVHDNDQALEIALSLQLKWGQRPRNHGWRGLGYDNEKGGRPMAFHYDAIAAYFEVAARQAGIKNNIPARMCPFPYASEDAVRFLHLMNNNVVVLCDGGKRYLNQPEQSLLIHKGLRVFGPSFLRHSRKLREYGRAEGEVKDCSLAAHEQIGLF